ncbi:MAG: hypothetical protein DRP10_04115 [Candidatus Aenigmatarchaeota archaeon]|nr:MAG: hypothetical protein DRP10_04115 [Candidatus Aenigmarchaeota archaeon]
MVNEFVRNKIVKDNLPLIGIGLLIAIGSIILNWIIWEIGYIVYIIYAATLIGVAIFFDGLFKLIYYPSNDIYKCWKFYGENDLVIEEVKKAISNKKKELESNELIISNGWIIKPKDFIFVKPKDVNWIYLSQQCIEGSNIYNQKIKIHTTFGLSFEVNCSPIQLSDKGVRTTEDVMIYLNTLTHFCKSAIIGYKPEFKLFWKKSPQDFIKRVKEYAKKHKK